MITHVWVNSFIPYLHARFIQLLTESRTSSERDRYDDREVDTRDDYRARSGARSAALVQEV